MAKHGPDQEERFLSRWSQRKQAARETAPDGAPQDDPQEAGRDSAAAAGEGPAAEAPAVRPEDLPDIETLDEASDFSAFLRPGVPEGLKQRALKKLWQVDPAFKHICMLDDYNLDYTDAAMVVPDLKTIYQVGKGMVLPEDEAAEEAAAPPPEGVAEAVSGGGEALPAPAADQVAGPAESADTENSDKENAGMGVTDTTAYAADDGTGDAAAARRAARNPGDPLVGPAPAQRRQASRVHKRSALRRRWGDGGA